MFPAELRIWVSASLFPTFNSGLRFHERLNALVCSKAQLLWLSAPPVFPVLFMSRCTQALSHFVWNTIQRGLIWHSSDNSHFHSHSQSRTQIIDLTANLIVNLIVNTVVNLIVNLTPIIELTANLIENLSRFIDFIINIMNLSPITGLVLDNYC